MQTYDRDSLTRENAELVANAWQEPGATYIEVSAGRVRTQSGTPSFQKTIGEYPGDYAYLGRLAGDPVFLKPGESANSSLSDADLKDVAGEAAATKDGYDQAVGSWLPLLQIAPNLDASMRELLFTALALQNWHEHGAYSPESASPTEIAGAGWMRVDANGIEHFPRTDPAVIVLVTHGERVLLGSNELWPAGRYSLFAGFVEAGESLESAVCREVFEESGVPVVDPRYIASQPWPFPRSLMLGFQAELAPGHDPNDVQPQPGEIREVRWFSKAEIINPPPGITLPGEASLAAKLLREWARS